MLGPGLHHPVSRLHREIQTLVILAILSSRHLHIATREAQGRGHSMGAIDQSSTDDIRRRGSIKDAEQVGAYLAKALKNKGD